VNRRLFVISTVFGTIGLAAGLALRITSRESAVVAVLRKCLPYLQLDEGGVARFAKDIVAMRVISDWKLLVLDAAGPLYGRMIHRTDTDPLTSAIRHGEDRILTAFLISSDFFLNGADESRVVHYLGYYDAVARPCSNPFARPVEQRPDDKGRGA
jgi:hypothetical protein